MGGERVRDLPGNSKKSQSTTWFAALHSDWCKKAMIAEFDVPTFTKNVKVSQPPWRLNAGMKPAQPLDVAESANGSIAFTVPDFRT